MTDSELNTPKIKILYVDDEAGNLIGFKSHFRKDYEVHTCDSAIKALEEIHLHDFAMVITDQRMPEMTGTEFLQKLVEINPEPIRVLLTGYTDFTALVDAINKGNIFQYHQKPWDEHQMLTTIKQGTEVFFLRRERTRLLEEVKEKNEKLASQNEELENLNNELEKVNGQLEFLLRQQLLS
ncbi:MAG: response regulator [Bacteroidota bacterium]|nr:response regulator [Bacteroidota bacterium]